jgi:hypothetical protein
MPDAPKVAIELIDRPNEKSLGSGEASQGPMAAANAFADATGKRLRDLPFALGARQDDARLRHVLTQWPNRKCASAAVVQQQHWHIGHRVSLPMESFAKC